MHQKTINKRIEHFRKSGANKMWLLQHTITSLAHATKWDARTLHGQNKSKNDHQNIFYNSKSTIFLATARIEIIFWQKQGNERTSATSQ